MTATIQSRNIFNTIQHTANHRSEREANTRVTLFYSVTLKFWC